MRLTPTIALLLAAPALLAQAPATAFTLASGQVKATISLREGHLTGERLAWTQGPGAILETDGGFRLDIVWNDWQAPKKANNGDVFCHFANPDFVLAGHDQHKTDKGEELSLTFKGPEYLGVEVRYTLGAGAHVLRRKVRVFEYPHAQYARRDPSPTGHLLHAVYAYDAEITSPAGPVNAGGFGQPVALTLKDGGAFAGLEWPAADNAFETLGGVQRLRAGQEMGEAIDFNGVWSDTAVLAVTPDAHIKDWFIRYLDEVRVAPLRPYTLYNSWYDLRHADYPRVTSSEVMNEENVLRIAKMVRENMVEKNHITMDAFVLDDGWDVYASDWVLRGASFPHGLKPIVEELKKSNTRLGIWYGPTGGYSFHSERTDWYLQNGYEVTSNNMLSVAGPKYAALFQKRTTDMARDGVAYYKWDGFQFVDNDPRNGGQIGIYSRRRAMENVIASCKAARDVNPDMFLNLTSGTWLSPWWLRFADQIWMDGGDFGSADVPSISTRDSSITYRDMVLYDDFKTKGLWFPTSNLMTHGILKGHIDVENIGRGEPLSKFADEVVFYLSRGVTMYELYIAPDILRSGEWKVLSESLKWARANFDLFTRGEMVGGDPGKSEPYGHVHFKGSQGFVAVRNPDIRPASIQVVLDPGQGLDPAATGLVLERVYPTRWVDPVLHKAGESLDLPLQGYESAVYQLRPLKDVKEPLVAGIVFEATKEGKRERVLNALEVGPGARILNPGALASLQAAGKAFDPSHLPDLGTEPLPFLQKAQVQGQGARLQAAFTLAPSARQATLGVLLRPVKANPETPGPDVTLLVDGAPVKADKVEAEGVWAWYTASVVPGDHAVEVALAPNPKTKAAWEGTAQVWITGTQALPGLELKLKGKGDAPARLLPPSGRGPLELPRSAKLGETPLQVH